MTQTNPSTPWRNITIGNIGDVNIARGRLASANIEVETDANDILERIPFQESESVLDLFRVSAGDLNVRDGCSIMEIHAAAEAYSLTICPPEVGPQLVIQYPKLFEPWGKYRIAMNPVMSSSGSMRVFMLKNYGETVLTTTICDEFIKWDHWSTWVFVRKQRTSI